MKNIGTIGLLLTALSTAACSGDEEATKPSSSDRATKAVIDLSLPTGRDSARAGAEECGDDEIRQIKKATAVANEIAADLKLEPVDISTQCTHPLVHRDLSLAGFVGTYAETKDDKATALLSAYFFRENNRLCGQAAALYALSECARTGGCEIYAGPGNVLPGGKIGQESEHIRQACLEATKVAGTIAKNQLTAFHGAGVFEEKGVKIEGAFSEGTLVGTQTLPSGVKAKGIFKVAIVNNDLSVTPLAHTDITISNADGSTLEKVRFQENGSVDYSEGPELTEAGKAKIKLQPFKKKEGWYVWVRDLNDCKPELTAYSLDPSSLLLSNKQETRKTTRTDCPAD
jgi:hypothetical protein